MQSVDRLRHRRHGGPGAPDAALEADAQVDELEKQTQAHQEDGLSTELGPHDRAHDLRRGLDHGVLPVRLGQGGQRRARRGVEVGADDDLVVGRLAEGLRDRTGRGGLYGAPDLRDFGRGLKLQDQLLLWNQLLLVQMREHLVHLAVMKEIKGQRESDHLNHGI